MGTRGEIYVRNSSAVIELWRHYDAYERYMKPYFKLFARYAAWCVDGQRHLLTYPEDVATMLITFDYEVKLSQQLHFSRRLFEVKPDLRPRGNIDDFEKVWILDIPDINDERRLVWRVRGFDYRYGANVEEMRDAIRRMEDAMLDCYLRKTSNFTLVPKNEGDGCKFCRYPGPLLLTEDPPVCAYCLVRKVKGDDFVKEQVEQILKVAPLISP